MAAQEATQVLFAEKALICGVDGSETINHAVLVVRDGLIEAVGREGEVDVPEGLWSTTSARVGSCRAW